MHKPKLNTTSDLLVVLSLYLSYNQRYEMILVNKQNQKLRYNQIVLEKLLGIDSTPNS